MRAVWVIDRRADDLSDVKEAGEWIDHDSLAAHRVVAAADVLIFSHGTHDLPGLLANRSATIARVGHGLTAFKQTRGRSILQPPTHDRSGRRRTGCLTFRAFAQGVLGLRSDPASGDRLGSLGHDASSAALPTLHPTPCCSRSHGGTGSSLGGWWKRTTSPVSPAALKPIGSTTFSNPLSSGCSCSSTLSCGRRCSPARRDASGSDLVTRGGDVPKALARAALCDHRLLEPRVGRAGTSASR